MKTPLVLLAASMCCLTLPSHGQTTTDTTPSPPSATEPAPPAPRQPNARPGKRFAALWKKLDTDADGFLTRPEFDQLPRLQRVDDAKRQRLFTRLDQNKDGKLGRRELAKLILRKPNPQRLMLLDTDRSGGVSFQELQAGDAFKKLPPAKQQEVFNRLDRNGDGVISPLDRPKGQKAKPATPGATPAPATGE